ncbi:MAG: aminotransferase class V-fold PLP-dependent enzyme [Pseudomonadota bacterium]
MSPLDLPVLDVDFVRAQFPAFADPDGAATAFMENAGGSYAAGAVIERLSDFYTRSKVQPYGAYPAAARAGAAMDEARARLAAMLNVAEDELLVGPSTSQNAYVLAQAFAATLEPGDEIVVTNQDHEANSGPWRRLAERGFVVREWAVDPETGHLDPTDLAGLLGPRTRVVAFTHASNIVAEINPVAEIAAMVGAAGAVSVVDGVSAAPHGLPDVARLGADAYLFSTYKTYGPHQGVMMLRRALAERLANQGHYFNDGYPTKRMVPAGPDHAQVAALAGICDYVDALYDRHINAPADPAGRARVVSVMMRAREIALTKRLLARLEGLEGLEGVRLLGPRDAVDRASTGARACARPGPELADALATHGIGAGGGSFYADRVLGAMGVAPEHGVLRLSFLHYTTETEIDRTAAAVEAVL